MDLEADGDYNPGHQGIEPFVIGSGQRVLSRPGSAVRRRKLKVKRGGSAA